MSKSISPVPEGQRLFAYLSVSNGAAAIDFYVRAFGARESYRLPMPDGRIGHAELTLAGSSFSLADEFPQEHFRSPTSLGASTVSLTLYVPDVDAFVAHAAAEGATIDRPAVDEFYGDRTAVLLDPFGHRWMIHSRRELLTPAEMLRRMPV